VAVINEAMARAHFEGQDPIGQRFSSLDEPDAVYEVAGVSGDARDHELRGPVKPRFYVSFLQSTEPLETFNFEIRAARPEQLVAAVRAAVRGLDPRVTIHDVNPLDANVDWTMRNEVTVAKLSAAFGLLALVLASVGLYGVVAHATTRRTNEIGIRMVLGAGRRRVVWMVLRETLALVLAGIAIGVPAVLLAARAVSGRLFGVAPHDPTTLVSATAVLLAVALLAGVIPGSRAARVDPSAALRHD
jgi:ABC-type antimicrobial peptide transport system permease subunit